MRGHPQFHKEQPVWFNLDGKHYTGSVFVVDNYGTFEDPSDVSYDILVDNWSHPDTPDKIEQCVFKHITEKLVHAL